MNSIDPKVAAGAVGTFLATLVVGLLNRYTSYQPTVEETGAIVGLFGFACAWLIPRFLRIDNPFLTEAQVEQMAALEDLPAPPANPLPGKDVFI